MAAPRGLSMCARIVVGLVVPWGALGSAMSSEPKGFLAKTSAAEWGTKLGQVLASIEGGVDASMRENIDKVMASLAPGFQTLAKNRLGRLTHYGVRHLLQTSVARERRLLVTGFVGSPLPRHAGPARADLKVDRRPGSKSPAARCVADRRPDVNGTGIVVLDP